MADSWADRAYLRGTQYKTDANLAARQSIYAYQRPRVDLAAWVAAALGDATAASGERVTLDDGESLASSFFGQVTRHDFPAELHVPAPGPIAEYVRSLSGGQPGSGQAGLAETVTANFPRTPAGHYVITTHAGCLVCRVD